MHFHGTKAVSSLLQMLVFPPELFWVGAEKMRDFLRYSREGPSPPKGFETRAVVQFRLKFFREEKPATTLDEGDTQYSF